MSNIDLEKLSDMLVHLEDLIRDDADMTEFYKNDIRRALAQIADYVAGKVIS